MAFCIKCGNELKEGELFCPKCGYKRYQAETTDSIISDTLASEVHKEVISKPVYHNERSAVNQSQASQDNVKQNESYEDLKNSLNGVKNAINSKISNNGSVAHNSTSSKDSVTVSVIVSGALLALSAFLPCIKIESALYSLSGLPSDISLVNISDLVNEFGGSSEALSHGVFFSGILLAALAVGVIIFAVLKNRSGACFFGVLAGLFGCYQAYLVYKIHGMDEIFGLGAGFYLIVIGSLAVIFTTYIDLMGNRMISKSKAQ